MKNSTKKRKKTWMSSWNSRKNHEEPEKSEFRGADLADSIFVKPCNSFSAILCPARNIEYKVSRRVQMVNDCCRQICLYFISTRIVAIQFWQSSRNDGSECYCTVHLSLHSAFDLRGLNIFASVKVRTPLCVAEI
ncbi:hypothetical protein AB6A40_008688 [Gnathostoma spinigerum]|uniref:Uncharacterized protein n=1 Tax=Gnathostoma spinigerum TaxID=75299 RepID=A0ABD6EXJ4_9BILA